jgi:hypothetical protein
MTKDLDGLNAMIVKKKMNVCIIQNLFMEQFTDVMNVLLKNK